MSLNETAANDASKKTDTDSAQPPEKDKKHAYSIDHLELKDPDYMNEVPKHLRNENIPGFPTTCAALGRPGSGKTNFLLNFLTKDIFWYQFYDKIYLLGPTIKSDKLWKKIKIPDAQIVTAPNEFINKLNEWTEAQVRAVESNPNTAPKCLFVFEDITAYHSTVQQHPDFIKCFTTIRHHKSTAYANIHKFKAFNRTARLACQHLMIWPVTRTELTQVFEDFGPDRLDKKDFFMMCDDAWLPDESNKKPFLYINMYAKEDQRFRKCLTHIIDVNSYEGAHKARKKITVPAGSKRKAVDLGSQPVKKPKENDLTAQQSRNSRDSVQSVK